MPTRFFALRLLQSWARIIAVIGACVAMSLASARIILAQRPESKPVGAQPGDSSSLGVVSPMATCDPSVDPSCSGQPQVTPKGLSVSAVVGANSYVFRVTNVGNTGATYEITTSCSGAASGCSPASTTTSSVSPGGYRDITVSYTLASSGSSPAVTLTAAWSTDPTRRDQGYIVPNVPYYTVAVTPDGTTVEVDPDTRTQTFRVTNTGNQSNVTYTLASSCTGAATCLGVSQPSVALSSGGYADVAVTYSTVTRGTTGTVRLQATYAGNSSVYDQGYVNVSVLTLGGTASAPMVDAASVNPGTTIERGLCLAIALPGGAASECGDLRLAFALPAARTLNKDRVPTLLYNSAHAQPRAHVIAKATLPAGAALPDSVVGVLKIDGLARDTVRWPRSSWQPGQTRLVVMSVDASDLPTGVHRYKLLLTNWYRAPELGKTGFAEGEFTLVNRKASPFGAGWWLAGLEQLYFPSSDTSARILVRGDGSTRKYTPVVGRSGIWATEEPIAPDTLVRRDSAGASWYVRKLPGGAAVWLNAFGQHVLTINRLGYATRFTYDTGGRLDTVIAPVPVRGPRIAWRFTYANGLLQSVFAPPAGTLPRGVTLAYVGAGDARVASLTHAHDAYRNSFGYDGPTNRIVTRTDARGTVAEYQYDPGQKVTSAHLYMRPAGGMLSDTSDIVISIVPQETRGLGRRDGTTSAADSASAYTRIDGPRPLPVADTAAYWLDRFGAPARMANPLGYVTVVRREDAVHRELPTRVEYPNGRVLTAIYNTRGNVTLQTDLNPYGDGRNPATRYEYTDARWPDFPTRIVPPEKDSTVLTYDGNGNRDSLQNALGETVAFYYDGARLFAGSLTPLATRKDSVLYDAMGNVRATRTRLGFYTLMRKDNIGRDTLVITPTDTSTARDTMLLAQLGMGMRLRTLYDRSGRDSLSETIGDSAAASGTGTQHHLFTTKLYDVEDNLLQLTRWTSPAPNTDPLATTWTYDRAGRKLTEVAPDGKVDSTYYDRAGHTVTTRSRRGERIVREFDAAGQLTKRILPPYTYSTSSLILAPLYQNEGSLTMPADTAIFAYDSAGKLTTANNADARVSRSYFKNGALREEVQNVREWASTNFAAHLYRLNYAYDADGRRLVLNHPDQLGVGSKRVAYSYDTAGRLASVTDPLSATFQYRYDAESRLDTLLMPGAVTEVNRYDEDGRLVRRVGRGPAFAGKDQQLQPTDRIYDDTLVYDARGKVIMAVTLADTVANDYDGMGALIHQYRGFYPRQTGGALKGYVEESHAVDALGQQQQAVTGGATRVYSYYRTSGRLSSITTTTGSVGDYLVDNESYDAVGNLTGNQRQEMVPAKGYDGESNIIGQLLQRPSVSLYDGEGKRRLVDTRSPGWNPDTPDYMSSRYLGGFEQTRYDALGRRVLVRTRKDSLHLVGATYSTIKRYVWDGDDLLYEIRYPGSDAVVSQALEKDTVTEMQVNWRKCRGTVADSTVPPQWQCPDSNLDNVPDDIDGDGYPDYEIADTTTSTFYGRVAYTHGGGVDHPLSMIRVGYGYQSTLYGPIQFIPHYDWRGSEPRATTAYGRDAASALPTPIDWLSVRRSAYLRWAPGKEPLAWMGDLISGSETVNGTLYMRNRYYDPQTGQFTQEDPIRLAGGLNLYGFAAGDPVNYADPFGLCKKYKDGSEDPDCRRLVNDLNATAADADKTLAPGERNLFREAAAGYEATDREVDFVGALDDDLNVRNRNGDDNPKTFALARTMNSRIVIGNFLGKGDVMAAATHEILVHGHEHWPYFGDAKPETAHLNKLIWEQLPVELRPSAELWRRLTH